VSQYAATVTVRLRADELANLDRAAIDRGCSRSDAIRSALAGPLPTGPAAADAIADLVRRMDTAEAASAAYRLEAERAHAYADQRVRDLQAETARREAGLVTAMWRALGQAPGTDRQLLDAVAHLAAQTQVGRR
jgi:hypothetical protein